jgi:hypothetical protein
MLIQNRLIIKQGHPSWIGEKIAGNKATPPSLGWEKIANNNAPFSLNRLLRV